MGKRLKINGPIISSNDKWFYDYFGMEATCPADVIDQLPESGEEIEVTINSYGGLVDVGNEIYTALRAYPGTVTANIVMAGSAASIIAMSADKVCMSPVGQIMIHNVAMGAQGDYHDMDKASEILVKANSSLANAYVIKTGKTKDEILKLMEAETWLTADEAVANSFADEIMFETKERPLLVADGGSGLVPQHIIQEMKDLKMQAELNEGKNKKPKNESSFVEFLF
ncbi:MAG: Clp protease ClpP [Lactococcus lactis]|nr:Clp protease ClpP [Lactococcus lactis]